MNSISACFTPTDSLGYTRRRIQDTNIQEWARGLSRSCKSVHRSSMRAAGYSEDQISELFPLGARGRPRVESAGFKGISAPICKAIRKALALDVFPQKAEEWKSPGMGAAAAAAIEAYYHNRSSAAATLTVLRTRLREVGADEAVIEATKLPALTIHKNSKAELNRLNVACRGVAIPDSFRTIEALQTRVESYIEACQKEPHAQMVADFMVTLSCRPGEVLTLRQGPGGGVVGMLKKRGVDEEFPIVSALPTELARKFLALWQDIPKVNRENATKELIPLTTSWGITRRDLRAIGSTLAQRAAVIEGRSTNSTQSRQVAMAALRHAKPPTQSVDHYQKVKDPAAELAAKLAELSVGDLVKVQKMVATLCQPPQAHKL